MRLLLLPTGEKRKAIHLLASFFSNRNMVGIPVLARSGRVLLRAKFYKFKGPNALVFMKEFSTTEKILLGAANGAKSKVENRFKEIVSKARIEDDQIVFKQKDWTDLLEFIEFHKGVKFEVVEIGRGAKIAESKVFTDGKK